ncbi:MAG TPA: CRISPR-associated protein Csx3 [Ktedonobacteraceae bacterium]|nr:CRISPR-associated protein Csx3 [Ktedonobacteraceae bacterium]
MRVNGPASLPCAFTIAHAVLHAYGAVAVWDPKLQKYVIAVVHNPEYQVGQLID